jgi:pimeloyl-[acyl-carrier protein] synthase
VNKTIAALNTIYLVGTIHFRGIDMRLREKIQFRIASLYTYSLSAYEQLRYGVALNPLSPKVGRNPYPYHDALREKRPIHFSPAINAFWVTRFDWVQEILRDKRFGADVRKHPKRLERVTQHMDEERLENFNHPSMLDLDPPDHTRIRRLASQGFINRFIQSLEPRIRVIVDECLTATANQSVIDFVDVVAKPLPAIVIAEMMGLPKKDHDQFQRWSEDLIDGTGTNDTDRLEASQQASRSLRHYFKTIIASKRNSSDEDLITLLIGAEEGDDTLSEIELYNTCLLLLVAGHETTTRLIGNGLYLLLAQPEQLSKLQSDPSLIPNAVEEMLRYEPPVQATRRFVMEDIEFHGTQFKKGELIFLSIAGSNRDRTANKDPGTFDVSRENVKQISFGYGIHLCLGIALARLEARVTFEEILSRYPTLSLADEEPAWGTNPFFRGLEHLNVRVEDAHQEN